MKNPWNVGGCLVFGVKFEMKLRYIDLLCIEEDLWLALDEFLRKKLKTSGESSRSLQHGVILTELQIFLRDTLVMKIWSSEAILRWMVEKVWERKLSI